MNNYSTAPVCVFVYKRLNTLKGMITSLQQNNLASVTDIHIFSDAAAKQEDIESVQAVRDFIADLKGFRSVSVYLSEKNNGLAQSIINGVTKIINRSGNVIVLEDDLVMSANFLDFMNQALSAYKQNEHIFSVSGYSSPVKGVDYLDVYFTKRSSSWGWATWKDRWDKIDWTVADFDGFIKDAERKKNSIKWDQI